MATVINIVRKHSLTPFELGLWLCFYEGKASGYVSFSDESEREEERKKVTVSNTFE
jgi:hypothetical protein